MQSHERIKFKIRPSREKEYMLAQLSCGAMMNSLFNEIGIRVHKPIALIVPDLESAETWWSRLSIWGNSFLSLNMAEKEFSRSIEDVHDDFVGILYSKGRNSGANSELLQDVCAMGRMNGMTWCCIPVIFFIKIVPEEWNNKLSFVIELDRPLANRPWKEEKERFHADFVSHVMQTYPRGVFDEAEHLDWPEGNRDTRFIDNVLSVFWKFMKASNQMPTVAKESLIAAWETLFEEQERYDLQEQIPEAFLQTIRAQVKKLGDMRDMGEISEKEPYVDGQLLYDETKYYIPEKVFSSLCQSLAIFGNVDRIKRSLEEAGILCTQGRGRVYRTIKTRIPGRADSPRFVWLLRSKVDILEGELALFELANTTRGRRTLWR